MHWHWATAYVGKPYRHGATGPEAYDCWGLLWHVYLHQFGIELPLMPGISEASAACIIREIDSAAREQWAERQHPKEGYAVAMSQRTAFHHVGVCVRVNGGLSILHAMDGEQVFVESLRRLKLRGIKRIAYFRHWLWPTS